jgi:hypothetical protein
MSPIWAQDSSHEPPSSDTIHELISGSQMSLGEVTRLL